MSTIDRQEALSALRELDVQCYEKLRDFLHIDLKHGDSELRDFVSEARKLVIAREEISRDLLEEDSCI